MPQTLDIQDIRKRLNWTRAKLAQEVGVNVSTVCRWENDGVPERGTARVTLERLARRAALRSAPSKPEAVA